MNTIRWWIRAALVVAGVGLASGCQQESDSTSPPTSEPKAAEHRDIVGTEEKLYSQFNEEIVVRDFFQDLENGFYLDIGCAWPEKSSTTYYLEKHLGWTGIGVDANAKYGADWAKFRPASKFRTYLVSDHSGSLDKFYLLEALGSTQKNRVFNDRILHGKEVEVPSITIDDLLERNGIEKIDFLSMDIEESEPAALAGFDIKRFSPKLVCIEASPSIRESILEYFADNDYERIEKYLEYDTVNWYFKPIGSE
jgi:FkbM family methyltransferase